MTVEDAFAIKGRGTALAPDIDLGERGSIKMRIELRRPDGTRETLEAHAAIPFVDGPNVVRRPRHMIVLDVPKTRVPIGTEIWTVEE
jgi:hypothetical protein